MRTLTYRPFGLMVPRSPAILVLVLTAVVALGGLAQAQPAAQPKTPASPPASPEKQPAQPAPAQAAQPAQPKQPAAARASYVAIPVTEDFRTKRMDIQRMLRAGNVPDDQRQTFDDYYRKYEFARWTAPDQLNQLPARRKDLINALRTAKISPAHDELVALTLDFLGTLASEPTPRHPAARFNAMMAIGELNAQEAPRVTDNPVPLPDALPVLLGALTDANQTDAVRFAAILGLYRHAELRIADPQFVNNQLTPALLTLAQTKTAAGRAPKGHAWLRARAIDTLGALQGVGQQNAVVKALEAIVADRDDDLLVRCAAARALGSLTYPADHGLDAWQFTSELGQLASDAALAELARMEEEAEQEKRKQRRPRSGMMGTMGYDMYGGAESGPDMMAEPAGDMYGGPMMPGGFGRPKEDEEKEDETLGNRRRLKALLDAVMLGLTGDYGRAWNATEGLPTAGVASLAAAPPESDNELVQGVLTEVVGLFNACDKPKNEDEPLDRETLRSKIEEQLELLTQALNKGRAPDAEEPAEAAPPADTDEPADAAAPAAKPAAPAAKPADAGQPAGNP